MFAWRSKNRRVFVRYACNFLISIFDKTANKEEDVQAQDISAEGIGVVSDKSFKEGDDVEIWIHLPKDSSPIHTHGTIVWSKKQAGYWRAGLKLDTYDLLPLGVGLEKMQGLQ